jgi:dTDP-4-amino-4,6-dideoxygalactose transaminase
VEQYETAIAAAIGRRHAVAFAYARTGLVAILQAAGLDRGDEVILSPLTCKVVPLALLSMGLKPVYADVSRRTLNLDPESVGGLVGKSTRAVLFQHTYGNAEGIGAIAEVCQRGSLFLVEDCAQSLPQLAQGHGWLGHAAIFSNNPRKPVPAGSGGVIATDDDALAHSIARIRDNLPSQSPLVTAKWAINVLLHDLLVGPRLYWPLFSLARAFGSVYQDRALPQDIALEVTQVATQASGFHIRRGLASLPGIGALSAQRKLCCEDYARSFRDCPEIMPLPAATQQPLYFFPVLVTDKKRLLRDARKRLLELVSWPMRLPIYPVERESDLLRYGYHLGSCANAEAIATRLVGLPTDFGATEGRRKALARLVKEHHANVQ